jgi:predicted ester cyclase
VDAEQAGQHCGRQAGRPCGGTKASSPEAVVRRFIEQVVNGGNLDVLDETWAQDMEWHGGSIGDIYGLPAHKEFAAANASGAFAGMHLDVKEVITSGDKVVARFTNSGTHTGPFMGAEATGIHAEWLGIGVYTVRNGKIVSGWFGEDVLGMMLQLGVVKL